MDKLSNLALVMQMIDAAEKNIQSAKQLIREMSGGELSSFSAPASADFSARAKSLSTSEGGRVIEGVFDGQNMIGPDGKQYPIPANYASKSKLVAGDVLKLSIAEDGSFIYKQIGPVDRKKMLGTLIADEKGELKVLADGKPYRVLLASLTYYKSEPGDQVTIIVPENEDTEWAAVENVIKAGSTDPEGSVSSGHSALDAVMDNGEDY